nr:immunoglobulin light chain junction region [Macaca mulatta]MOX17133.1 immunoglobulin light chain junction region [Macaca mulatta]MOX17364.1 immunoglobulin light chain junction region [Macaca mulatta]MOX19076.1 immunoglobulin light chain junction region [Macaca mulatta]MOX19098.1 immunoglobulin light chain junction region [Macaca mulatta]
DYYCQVWDRISKYIF